MWEIVPAETHSTFFPFQNLDSWAICTAKYLFSGIGFLNIQPDNVQTADSQAIQASSFSQMGFLGWDFQWFSWINALTLFGAKFMLNSQTEQTDLILEIKSSLHCVVPGAPWRRTARWRGGRCAPPTTSRSAGPRTSGRR